jgi:hypothetical protein
MPSLTSTVNSIPIWGIGFPILFFIIGFFQIKAAWHGIQQAKASRQWPQLQGKLIHLDYQELSEDSQKKKNTTIILTIKYSYELNGKTLIGTKIGPWEDDFLTANMKERIYEKIKNATEITIYYNPSQQDDVSILTGGESVMLQKILFGLVFIGAALLVFYCMFHNFPTLANGIQPFSQE